MFNRKHRRSVAAMMTVAGGLVAAVAAPIVPASAEETGAQKGTTSIQCSASPLMLCNELPPEFLVVGNKLYFVDKDGTRTEAPDGNWKGADGKVITVRKGEIVKQ